MLNHWIDKYDFLGINKFLLTEEQILQWCEEYFEDNGKYPKANGEKVRGYNITWNTINKALMRGSYGLPGGITLANFLKEKNGLPTKPLPKFRRKRKNRKINNKQPGQEKKDTIKVLKPSLPKGRKKKKTQNLKPKKIDKALRKSSKKKFDSSRGLN